MDTVGCILAPIALVVMYFIDGVRWTPLQREDRLAAVVWPGLAVSLGASLALSVGTIAHSATAMLGAISGLIMLGLWAQSLLTRKSATAARLGVFARPLAALATGYVLLWCFEPSNPLRFLEQLGRLENLGPLEVLKVASLVVTLAGATAVPMLPTDIGVARPLWMGVRAAHGATRAAAWALVGLAFLAVMAIWSDFPWGEPSGRRGMDMLARAGAVIGLHLLLLLLIGMTHVIGEDAWTLRKLERFTLERLRQPWRSRFTWNRRKSLTDGWRQVLPTTGLPFFIGGFLIAAAADAPVWGLAVVALAGFGVSLSVLRAHRRKNPFGALDIDLTARTQVEAIKGLKWHPDHGLLLDPEVFTPSTENQKPLEAAITFEGERWATLSRGEVLMVGIEPVLNVQLEAAEGAEGEEGGDKEKEEKEKEAYGKNWRLVVEARGLTLRAALGSDLEPVHSLELMADLWVLASKLGCTLRLPHRRLPEATWSAEGLSERIINDHIATMAPGPEAPSADNKQDDKNDDVLPTDLLDAKGSWLARQEDDGRWWLIAPQASGALSGGLWLVFVALCATAEAGYRFLVFAEGNTWTTGLDMLARACLTPMVWAMAFERIGHQRLPDIYCLAVRDDGLHLHDRVVPWSRLADINTLGLNPFPLAVVSEGHLLGLPCPVPERDRLTLAAEIGQTLRRIDRETLRRASWSS